MFPVYLTWQSSGCPPFFAFHLAFIYFRVPVLEQFVRNTCETYFFLCSIYVLEEEINEQYVVNYYRTLTFGFTSINTVLWLSVRRNSIVLPVALWIIQLLKYTQLSGQVQTCWPISTE
jgi:hypothetical protein